MAVPVSRWSEGTSRSRSAEPGSRESTPPPPGTHLCGGGKKRGRGKKNFQKDSNFLPSSYGSSSPRPINPLCARGPGPPPKPSPGAQTWERAQRHASAPGNGLHPGSDCRWVAIATAPAVTHGGPPGRGSRGAAHRTAADLARGRGLHRPRAARGRRDSLFLRPALAPPPPPPDAEPPGGVHAESAAASRGGLPPSPSPASRHSRPRSLWEQNFHLQNVKPFLMPRMDCRWGRDA